MGVTSSRDHIRWLELCLENTPVLARDEAGVRLLSK